ncbi:uncharacterized protein LOC124155395 [Ischnura elegans]|uniref:uncharacterized protein LOC124155395 n=1 Tax=Ischnura elegans TaxID=197161 RepID=UPI001ED87644|nr:uncharacterized protein LOC124155395 [Ischnura elegans]
MAAKRIAVFAIVLALAAMLAAKELPRNSDVSYDEDDGADLLAPDEQGGRERRQADWWSAPQASCRLTPAAGQAMHGQLHLLQKPWRLDTVKVKGALWGTAENKERFDVSVHERAPATPGDCDDAGDPLRGPEVNGYLGQVKARGRGRASGFSRSVRGISLESNRPNSVAGRSIVVTSQWTRRRVACCTIVQAP